MKQAYRVTMNACFMGYVTQAIVKNFAPLLFVTFKTSYGIDIRQITLLITINFIVQLIIDLLSAKFVDKLGYRFCAIAAHVCAAAGLIMMAIAPLITKNVFAGLAAAVVVYAVGGGLIEVIVSPIIEACPTKNKERTMSVLHSFYCWGYMGVVLISTAFFALFGIEKWFIMGCVWAVVPIVNIVLFSVAPIYSLSDGGVKGKGINKLLREGSFWLFMLMMLCAGAAEQTVAQWASAFAEQSLGVGKVLGDLLGPMTFALAMGAARLIFGLFGGKIKLNVFMTVSSALCAASYLCLSLTAAPAAGLAGCALCGFSVGIMWPGTYSKAASYIKGGGTTLFALLALGGDIGCTVGPGLAGAVSDMTGGNLKAGILAAAVFPAVMLVCCVTMCKMTGGKRDDSVGARAADEDNDA